MINGVDFYLACLQNARRNREREQSGFITGKTKSDLIFYPEDRPVMLECLKMVKKPVDIAAIGVFQRDKDQILEDAELYAEWYNGQ